MRRCRIASTTAGASPGLQRVPGMGEPFVLRRPVPGDQQHHQLEQPQVEVAVAQVVPNLSAASAIFGLRSQIANGPRTVPPRVPAMRSWMAFCSGVRLFRFQVFHTGHSVTPDGMALRRRVSDNSATDSLAKQADVVRLVQSLGADRSGERRHFLGVEQSATGRAWRDRLDERGAARALAIAQRHDLPDLLARVLAGRGVEIDDVAGAISIRPCAR